VSKSLVIVESPAKAKTINKILGPEYVVKACMGHVRDLPRRKLGVDIEKGFKPQYVTIKGKEKVLKEIQQQAAKCETVYLAPDPDREGEAIAWHLVHLLKKEVPEDRCFRVTYNEITAPAIRKAFSQPGRIDLHKVDSQQARRVLDRIVGYQVSPLLWRRIRGAASAGRVQSVALRLVCEREAAILKFTPEEFWLLGARVAKQVDPRDPFSVRLARINGEKPDIKNEEQTRALLADLEGRELVVASLAEKEISKRPPPPYITSTLQQAGSRFCGYSPSRTMKLAQALYEGEDFGEGPVGLITYMRTDSVSISREAQEQCRRYIGETYGAEYVPDQPHAYKSRGSAQEAHEAIRPTDVGRTPESLAAHLEPDELKLYQIIWQRFVASQMASARIAQQLVEVAAPPPAGRETTYTFRASASQVVFPGYMKVTGVEEVKKAARDDGDEAPAIDEEIDRLPPLREGETLERLDWLSEQKFTQPPGRYTEASLVRALEENGVGRPSTYAQILATLQGREYVTKEKRSLRPTPLGMSVNEFLVEHLPELFDVKFTAGMEENLDQVESGAVEWTHMLQEFYGAFEHWLVKARGPDAKPETVRALIELLKQVKTWNPPIKRGKRTYDDPRFIASLEEQLNGNEKPLSERQMEALKRMVIRYRDQIADAEAGLKALGLTLEVPEHAGPPSPDTLRKLELLKAVTFSPPRQVGKKTYDDRVFSASLREQVESGRGLSPNQMRYLDRLVHKYAKQIPNYDGIAAELGMDQVAAGLNHDVGPLLDALKHVAEWKPPVQRGKRTWDDQKFFTSLKDQFEHRRGLSDKQALSLKKMIRRYADQVPDYDRLADQLGLPPRKAETDY
jgi:DNA topoisomerase-1